MLKSYLTSSLGDGTKFENTPLPMSNYRFKHRVNEKYLIVQCNWENNNFRINSSVLLPHSV